MPLTERDVNIPHKAKLRTPPALKSPQPHSKLPLRVVTPSSAPSTATWSPRVADRTASAERAASEARKIPRPNHRSDVARLRPETQKASSSAIDKPLPQEKPLPSRPIVRLSSMLSPSRDSRTLIDACDKPLHLSSNTGDRREWPSLSPQPSGSTDSTSLLNFMQDGEVLSGPPSYLARSSMMTAAAEMTNVMTGESAARDTSDERESCSAQSSYATAVEKTSPSHISRQSSLEAKGSWDGTDNDIREHNVIGDSTTNPDFQPRKESLRNKISVGSLVAPMAGPKHHLTDFTDLNRAEVATPASIESRTHSPSPASFSRPRPRSSSTGSLNVRSMKTASRIPISDSKKAIVVDVKKDQFSTPPIPSTTGTPTFGSRRLASPDALKILEIGKMRRQMQREPTDASSHTQTETTSPLESPSTTSRPSSPSYRLSTSSEAIFQPNSAQESNSECARQNEETPTPLARYSYMPNLSHHGSSTPADRSFVDEDKGRYMFGGVPASLLGAPPQTSPFTEPLQSIPSEALLSLDPQHLSSETRDQLIRTLSHLEGTGSPPKSDVDNRTLLHMFGHLRRGLEKNPQNSTILAQQAAAADQFLALRGSCTSQGRSSAENIEGDTKTKTLTAGGTDIHKSILDNTKKQTVISKWSSSTPSDKALSPPSDGMNLRLQHMPSDKPPHQKYPSSGSVEQPVSIGYPSRIPGRATTTNIQASDDAATVASIPSRRSSPTLGKRKVGSVRDAREDLQVTTASFARPTAAAESKKTAKASTPNIRAFSVPESNQRGRTKPIDKPLPSTKGLTTPKIPRSHSKSRFVLDKINGLFSGKRERRSVVVPPVPRIEENHVLPKEVDGSSNGVPTRQSAGIRQLPKMPSLSPSSQMALRSASRATTRTDDTTLVDRISLKDETQCVQMLSEHLVGKARREMNVQRQERLLTFAKVLNDSLISAREAAICAETAKHAAKSAQVSYEMTQKSLAMVQRLAASLARAGNQNRR